MSGRLAIIRGLDKPRARGFSLLELVLVVVIIGLVAAIAVPKLSRGAVGTMDTTVSGNLAVLREAIEHYASEHGGAYPTAANISNQLAQYSSSTGATSATKDGTYSYGPYIRTIPALPVGAKKGQSGIAAADGATVGWIYNETTGAIVTNTADTEVDSLGKKYRDY